MSPFWSDDFDMDALKLWPDLAERIGAVEAGWLLYTHGNTTHGRLNHPSVWNGYEHLEAFFGPSPDATGKPGGHWTDSPVVECTWLEVIRDWWVHGYAVIIRERVILPPAPYRRLFYPLMADLRGWTPLDPQVRDKLRGEALALILAGSTYFGALALGVER